MLGTALFTGMAVSCVQQLFVAFAGTKALSMAAVACGSLANISFPAISSIKSKSVPRHEQAGPPFQCPVLILSNAVLMSLVNQHVLLRHAYWPTRAC